MENVNNYIGLADAPEGYLAELTRIGFKVSPYHRALTYYLKLATCEAFVSRGIAKEFKVSLYLRSTLLDGYNIVYLNDNASLDYLKSFVELHKN